MPARSDTVALVGISSTVAVVDQLAKSLVASTIGPGGLESQIEVVDSWLVLEYTQNARRRVRDVVRTRSDLDWGIDRNIDRSCSCFICVRQSHRPGKR